MNLNEGNLTQEEYDNLSKTIDNELNGWFKTLDKKESSYESDLKFLNFRENSKKRNELRDPLLSGLSTDNDLLYEHFAGIVIKMFEAKNSIYFSILCDGKEIKFKTNLFTVFSDAAYETGNTVEIIGGLYEDYHLAKAVCSQEFYNIFKNIDDLEEKVKIMQDYTLLTPSLKEKIREQLNETKYELTGEQEKPFTERKELYAKYMICKNTYTSQQQIKIEELFNNHSIRNSLIDYKLKVLLNISNTYKNRKILTYGEIIQALDKKMYGMERVKIKIAEAIVSSSKSKKRGLHILLVGSPGVGKTEIARAVSEMFGVPYAEIPMESMICAIDLKGVDPSFDKADFGILVKTFYEHGTTDMVVVLDELDKMGNGYQDGNAANSLLDTLSDISTCYDHYAEMAFNTENTIYIATANSTKNIPDYLLSRFTVIIVDDYEDEEKAIITEDYIIPKVLESFDLTNTELFFSHESVIEMVKNYSSDGGARMLNNDVEFVARAAIADMERSGAKKQFLITSEYVKRVLEPLVDVTDPNLIFSRNKEKYSLEMVAEIKKTQEQISTIASIEEKDREIQRLKYLTSMFSNNDAKHVEFNATNFFESINRSVFGMDEVKIRIAEYLNAKSIQNESTSSVRILLVGPPGIGKTSIAKAIAEGTNRKFVKVSLNGISDNQIIKGFHKSYIGADAGVIVKAISNAKSDRIVMLLDEFDKLGSHHGIKVSNSFIDLFDNYAEFTDDFVGKIDCSKILFVVTCNDISNIEPWILDRFDIIRLDGYTIEEKSSILTNYVIPREEKKYSENNFRIVMTDKAKHLLLNDYSNSLGVRDLEKNLTKLVNFKLLKHGKTSVITITEEDIVKSLGLPSISRGNLFIQNVPGYVKAMGISDNGCGGAFAIEASIIHDSNATIISGLPEERVIDMVTIAKTLLRTKYIHNISHMNISGNFGLHLHFGGLLKKDDPSIGVAIFMAILSALKGTPIEDCIAFIGIIDLFGGIYPIDGIKTKIQVAVQSNCKKVFIPRGNFERLKPEEIKNFNIEVIPVNDVQQVIGMVYPKISKHYVS